MSQAQVTGARNGAYPLDAYVTNGRPSFRSATPGSAVWLVVRGDQLFVYRSQGLTVVQAIQCALGVKPDGFWGRNTNAALRRALEARGLDASFVRDGRIDALMLEAALALTFGSPYPVDPSPTEDTIVVAGTTMPGWVSRPPRDGDYNGLVWGAEMPMSARLPDPRSHAAYGADPICTRFRNARARLGLTRPAGDIAGAEKVPEPILPIVSDGTQMPGDGPGVGSFLVAGGVLTSFALAMLLLIDDT